MPVIDHTLF